jgi:hypothetical protein
MWVKGKKKNMKWGISPKSRMPKGAKIVINKQLKKREACNFAMFLTRYEYRPHEIKKAYKDWRKLIDSVGRKLYGRKYKKLV